MSNIQKIYALLQEKREHLLKKVKMQMRPHIPKDITSNELDIASSETSQNLCLMTQDRERSLLQQIEYALSRIKNKTYHLCLNCHDTIDMARLLAHPTTTLCIACKETQERKEKEFSNNSKYPLPRSA